LPTPEKYSISVIRTHSSSPLKPHFLGERVEDLAHVHGVVLAPTEVVDAPVVGPVDVVLLSDLQLLTNVVHLVLGDIQGALVVDKVVGELAHPAVN